MNRQSNKSTIANNSIALFFRMLLRMCISIYTTRVILEVLGVEDYGIYNLVAGFTLFFAFFNSTMSGSISRFISYDIGSGNLNNNKTFATAFTIQIIIALIIVILLETVGLWFINQHLVIPGNRLFAANVIYQFTIAGMVATVLQVPFSAAIIAYEKMTIYAYIEIINALLLLIIVFLLKLFNGDKLILYGALYLTVILLILITYFIICHKKFPKCKIEIITEKKALKPMLSFSGWDLFANISLSAHQQGVNIILNMFWGTIINAAVGIANQIYSAVIMFSSSITTAVRPQIIKAYASKNFHRAEHLTIESSRFLSLINLIICVPLIINSKYILNLWLTSIPPYAILLTQIILINQCIGSIKSILIIYIHATGIIKKYSQYLGILYLSAIPILYTLSKIGVAPHYIYGYIILLSIGTILLELYFMNKISNFHTFSYIHKIIIPLVITLLIPLLCGFYITSITQHSTISLVLLFISEAIFTFFLGYMILLNKDSRVLFKSYISSIIKSLKK